jgi:hypothetical protein
MSFPPSLKRCRKNVVESFSTRNRPLVKFSGKRLRAISDYIYACKKCDAPDVSSAMRIHQDSL